MKFITGNYYVWEGSQGRWIYRYNQLTDNDVGIFYGVAITSKKVYKEIERFVCQENTRLATHDEIRHLEACNKAGGYVEPIKTITYEIY